MILLLIVSVALLSSLVILRLLVLLQLKDMQRNTQARFTEAYDELQAAEFELEFLRSIDREH